MKKVLVTGASRGIGLAITKRLASEDFQIMLVARSIDRLKEIIISLPGKSHQCLRADLSLNKDIDKLVNHISEQKYDVLINNAGMGLYGRFDGLPLLEQTKILTLNCNALVSMSYAFLKQARPGDALVNIASVLGFSSFPGAATYAGTKGFVVRFSESLYYEFKSRDIYVVAFCPGITSTDFHSVAGGAYHQYPKIIVQTPEQVAEQAIKSLKKRKKPVVVSGAMNRGMLLSHRLMSRKQVSNIMGAFSPIKK